MPNSLSYGASFPYATWGSTFNEVVNITALEKIFICHAQIADLEKVAFELSQTVVDHNWILDLDHRARRAYETTALKTAKKLVEVFKVTTFDNRVTSEFGELMVSMGASKALEIVFQHRCIPLAELWKPNLSQNEGFDFHTVCPSEIINFGEAKFSSTASPYGGNSGDSSGAGGQADGFIGASKHLMDNVHLGSLAGEKAALNLDNDQYGVVLAFSINASNPLLVLKNALEQAQTYENLKGAKNIYIVGVSHESDGN
ncbi:hypothetical protein BEL04_08470 [Mucilaginibacter sp. PPCGB 2223]|uniref:hypothetical protein n=1 Tax=Mucilaginibacter sp. PPCGB 2223 TaxID=1886027 RepID=UPI000826C9BD|nr:hypothetical protein [Mucilaginibacter sp. PPCGB 2223]OCX54282.1 hypothetical protein BEL04_08470 [Mucilaginibacter sp. PPCGB 2223]